MKENNYRWLVLVGLTFIYFASNGYGYLSIPTFYPSLSNFLNVPKGEIPQAASLLTFTIALTSPILGYFLDKYSAKKILVIGSIGLALMLFYFSRIQTLNEFRLFNIGYALMLNFGGFFTSMYILNKWFEKNRGIALGIFLNASSIGAAFFSPLIGNELKNGTNWQEIASKLCIYASLLLILPLFIIKNPAKGGITTTEKSEKNTVENSFFEIFKTPKFWLMVLATGFIWFCMNSFLFHKDSFLSDLNLTPDVRGKFSQLFFICGVFGKFTFGYLSDKINKRKMMLLAITCIFVGVLLMKIAQQNLAFVPLIAIIFGIGYSGSFTMIQLMIAEHYSGVHFGKILGIFLTADTLFGALGTYTLGSVRSTTGNYNLGLNLLIIISIFAFFFIFSLKNPKNIPE